MTKEEFSEIRGKLGKTQAQMAQLLGTSIKAIQSFEQGLRKVPVYAERQILFLLATAMAQTKKQKNCWKEKKCPLEARQICPAWEYQIGHLCWFINGTICDGTVHGSWEEKMKVCRNCKVFQDILPATQGRENEGAC
jgi:DNA-binding XRE family transcriptional regulator